MPQCEVSPVLTNHPVTPSQAVAHPHIQNEVSTSTTGRLSSKVTLLIPHRSLLLPIAANTVLKSCPLQSKRTVSQLSYGRCPYPCLRIGSKEVRRSREGRGQPRCYARNIGERKAWPLLTSLSYSPPFPAFNTVALHRFMRSPSRTTPLFAALPPSTQQPGFYYGCARKKRADIFLFPSGMPITAETRLSHSRP